jgi:hypothetical protein
MSGSCTGVLRCKEVRATVLFSVLSVIICVPFAISMHDFRRCSVCWCKERTGQVSDERKDFLLV